VLARDWGLGLMAPLVSWCLGHAEALSGQIDEGLARLQDALVTIEAMEFGLYYTLALVHLGEGCLLAGRLDGARALAVRALALARERRQRGYEARALRLLGEVAVHVEPASADTAEDYYRDALALAEEIGMRPLAAHCHLGLGTLYRRTGKREQAQEHLTTAAAMYREMDMGFWLEKAEAEMRELG
jgi:tetratricopeptide (TPR) repeat protein